MRGDLDGAQFSLTGGARIPVVHGEGPQHLTVGREDGLGPAGAQSLLQRQFAQIGPTWIGGDVLDDHALAKVGGGAAGADLRADLQSFDGVQIALWQADGSGVAQAIIVVH